MNDEWGPVIEVAALIAGIEAGEHRVAVIVLVLCAAAIVTFVGARRVVLVALALAVVGCACMTRALDGQRHSPLARVGSTQLSGTLINDPDGPRFSASVLVRTEEGIVLATSSGADAMRMRVLEAGDRVRLGGVLGPVRGRERWQHAAARFERAQVLALRPPRGLFAVADSLRGRVLAGTRALPSEPRDLVAGFLLGDTRAIPAPTTAAYRAAGLSHLLAVSGENVAFVLALIGPLLRRMRLGLRTLTALAVILVFATMTRFEPSVLRASVMAVIALLAVLAGRPASRLRLLAYAMIALLIADPFLLHSVGFLLSCGAAAGIAFATPAIMARLPGPAFVREPLAVSLGAQVGVTPVLMLAFGSVPLVTPITNMLAAPAAELVGVYGFAASVIAAVVPATGPIVHVPTLVLVEWISAIARAGAAVPLQLTARGALGIGAIACALASVACARARADGGAVPEGATG
jgi:competence protein ComEC